MRSSTPGQKSFCSDANLRWCRNRIAEIFLWYIGSSLFLVCANEYRVQGTVGHMELYVVQFRHASNLASALAAILLSHFYKHITVCGLLWVSSGITPVVQLNPSLNITLPRNSENMVWRYDRPLKGMGGVGGGAHIHSVVKKSVSVLWS